MEPKISYTVRDELTAGVITTATLSEKQRPGLWQDMLRALDRGAAGTEAGTAGAFLFQAMVDRLLEDGHSQDGQTLASFPYPQMKRYVEKVTRSYARYQELYPPNANPGAAF